MNDYLPISKKDMRKRGWDEVDFVYVCGDAYVDHPSFGMAIISTCVRGTWFSDWCYLPAGLERRAECAGVWQTTFGIFGVCRQYGFYGQSLYCFQEKTPSRRLYSGRRYWKTSGSCNRSLLQFDPSKCINRFRSLSEESRLVFADWHIMIIGQTA